MQGANFQQKNLLKDLIYLSQTKPVNKETIKGLFRFGLEALLEAPHFRSLVLLRLMDTDGLESILKRLEFGNSDIHRYSDKLKGQNLENENIWGSTEFLVILSPRYSVVLIWDYSTETIPDTSAIYYLLNSKDVNNVVKVISDNSKIDLARYIQEFTPERRSNQLLNNAVNKFINFADTYVEEKIVSEAEMNILEATTEQTKQFEYISEKAKFISHEIKNHISVIDLFAKIIEKRALEITNDEILKSIQNAVTSIKKSKNSITELMSELRSIQGLNLVDINLKKLLDDTVNLVLPLAEEKEITLSIKNKNEFEIIADENKFSNVLINLLYNAIDATANNGKITVSAEETEEGMIKIEIADNGTGIAKEQQNRIFEQGFTTKPTGSGLGLYISKKSLSDMYGELNLVKSDENGTTFEVKIPKI